MYVLSLSIYIEDSKKKIFRIFQTCFIINSHLHPWIILNSYLEILQTSTNVITLHHRVTPMPRARIALEVSPVPAIPAMLELGHLATALVRK
jgi:hypothetical protein